MQMLLLRSLPALTQPALSVSQSHPAVRYVTFPLTRFVNARLLCLIRFPSLRPLLNASTSAPLVNFLLGSPKAILKTPYLATEFAPVPARNPQFAAALPLAEHFGNCASQT